MPIEIIAIATLLGLAILGVVILYTITMFREWVQAHIGNYRTKQLFSGMVRQHLESGDYKLVQFIFDDEKAKFLEAEAIQASSIDDELDEKLTPDNSFVEKIIN